MGRVHSVGEEGELVVVVFVVRPWARKAAGVALGLMLLVVVVTVRAARMLMRPVRRPTDPRDGPGRGRQMRSGEYLDLVPHGEL